ncbi:MAG: protein kinase, partial [Myxococcota bacterium]
NGTRIVTASSDKTARVWSADGTGQPLVLHGHQDSVYSAAFSPDENLIATASWDKTARVWSAAGIGQPLILSGHDDAVATGIPGGQGAFDPFGARIVTASEDGTIRLWNTDGTGEPIIIRAPGLDAHSAAFSPDGARIASASHTERIIDPDGTVRTEHTAKVWTDIKSISGPDDPVLWTATTFCPTIEQRMDLLGVTETQAEANFARCQRRVAEAQAGAKISN